ncbi:MAG: carbohydrate-binding family 9-like protein [Kiritimatiellia bacterium]
MIHKTNAPIHLLAGAICLASATLAQALPVAPRTGEIHLDGRLDEPAWEAVSSSEPFRWIKEWAPQDGRAPAPTTFKMLHDSEAVYLGITCHEPSMATLQDTPEARDGSIFARDCIEIFLNPEGSGVTYYQFALSAGNDQWDNYFIEGGQTTIGEYSSVWDSAVYKGADFWSVEVRIPLATFFHTEPDAFGAEWQVNVGRERQLETGGRELTTWSPLSFAFNEIQQWRKIGGLPSKQPERDIAFLGTDIQVVNQSEEELDAVCTLRMRTGRAAAGAYNLTITDAGDKLISKRHIKLLEGERTVHVDGIRFRQTGRTLLKLELETPQGQWVNGAYVSTRIDYENLTVILDEPFYRNNFYPGQDSSRITGTVMINLATSHLAQATLAVELHQGDRIVAKSRNDARQRTNTFLLSTPELAIGQYELVTQLHTGQKLLAEGKTEVAKLASPTGSCVYIDRDLNTVFNGEPLFVRSFMGGPGWIFSQALLDAYGEEATSPFVNQLGGSHWLHAERFDTTEKASGRIRLDVKPSQKVFDTMREVIEANKDRPDFWFYYLADEPECRNLSPVYLRHQYEFARRLDPFHPVMIITRDPARYVGCADILNPHPYLGPTVDDQGHRTMRSPKKVREVIRTVIEAGNRRIAPWCTPQAFSYKMVDSRADFPNFTEFNCMIFTAIANGAKGITPWTYRSIVNSLDLRLGYDVIYETLAALESFLIHPGSGAPVQVTAPDDGVDVLIKPSGDAWLVLAVNLLDSPTTAHIESSVLKSLEQLHGFRDSENPKVLGGMIDLKFEPYQVRLFTHPVQTNAFSTFAEEKAVIERAKDALRKPGNILFGKGSEIEWDASDTYMKTRTLGSLTDGLCDTLGWMDVRRRVSPAWLEMLFPTFVPKFRTAKIYSSTISDLDFLIWKAGEWKKIGEVRDNQESVITLNFPETLSTVKIRLVMHKTRSGTKAELYEIELYP